MYIRLYFIILFVNIINVQYNRKTKQTNLINGIFHEFGIYSWYSVHLKYVVEKNLICTNPQNLKAQHFE